MRKGTLIVRNKGETARDVKEGSKGSTVTLDAVTPPDPHSSHGCKVGDEGVLITGAGPLELEAGEEALVLKILGDDGETLSEQVIAAGATVSVTGAHELLIELAPEPVVEAPAAEAGEAAAAS